MLRLRPVPSLLFLPLGAAAAVVGLLPWLITGARLPLQNLWASSDAAGAMPVTLLPFSQYEVSLIVALVLVGSAIAGIVGRAVPARHPGRALGALLGGVLLVQLVATVQTAVTVSAGLRDGRESTIYLAGLVTGTVAAILVGAGVLALIARAPRAGALIGLAVAAIAFGSWISGVVFPVGTFATSSPLTNALGEVVRIAPSVVVGLAVAWCGLATVGRVIAAVASLALLWVGPTLVTAVTAALGSRVLARFPSEMLDYGLAVFRSALGMPELWLPPVLLAAAIAAIGVVARRAVTRRRATS